MTSLLLPVERLDNVEAVFGVDPNQLHQDKANGASFGRGLDLQALPQFGVDVAQREVLHGGFSFRTNATARVRAADQPSCDVQSRFEAVA